MSSQTTRRQIRPRYCKPAGRKYNRRVIFFAATLLATMGVVALLGNTLVAAVTSFSDHGVSNQRGGPSEAAVEVAANAGNPIVDQVFQASPSGVYRLAAPQELPEVVANDKRGAYMIWPAQGNLSCYFHEEGPYWVGGYHQGLDIAAQYGWNVLAAWDGKVIEAQEGWNRGYGTTVVLDHRNGIQTRYAHMSYLMVEPGDEVEAGELIGSVGSTGASEGPHLHFEVVVDGEQRDPLDYLPADNTREYTP